MNKRGVLVFIYILSLVLMLAGAILKLMHLRSAEALLAAAIICTIIFLVLTLREVLGSRRMPRTEKIMWAAGLVCCSSITGLLYLAFGRSKINAENSPYV